MKKIFSFLACFLILTASLFAVPGFKSYLKDSSGQYVYYRDSSFVRESYIGILTYDEATYQVRYFAPKDAKKNLPEKDIAILLTVNPDANSWEMTGERIISKIQYTQEDVDIINYLHDLLYEFSSCRNKIDLTPNNKSYVWGNDFWENGITKSQDYAQFGGNVTITFDCLIPLFNIKCIYASDGSMVFRCATMGTLKSSDDTSFSDFKGIKTYNPLTDTSNVTSYKATKSVKHLCDNRSVMIDTNWNCEQEIPNFCTLNNDSVITMITMPKLAKEKLGNDFYSIFSFLNSVNSKYTDLSSCEIQYDSAKKSYKITIDSYLAGSNSCITAVTKLLPNSQDGFDVFIISTFKKAWLENQDYFEKIISSYK